MNKRYIPTSSIIFSMTEPVVIFRNARLIFKIPTSSINRTDYRTSGNGPNKQNRMAFPFVRFDDNITFKVPLDPQIRILNHKQ
jgi:hypothetical protein